MDLANTLRLHALPISRSPSSYAVIDVESTGIFPAGNDRILEVAVVRLDATGESRDEFVTLVNPNRDVGPTHLHGIRPGDVIGAPTFAEVAPHLLRLLSGCVVVGHNVRFDLEFLRYEMLRLGLQLPRLACTCTLQLAAHASVNCRSRKLADVCDALGIALSSAHSALDDARAAARVFAHLRNTPVPIYEKDEDSEAFLLEVDALRPAPEPKVWTRRAAAEERNVSMGFLADVVRRLPLKVEGGPSYLPYYEVLDRVLEDRLVTREEAKSLEELALTLGLSRSMVESAHEAYFSSLASTAAADHVISESERADLETVAVLLGLDRQRAADLLDIALRAAKASTTDGVAALEDSATGAAANKLAGLSVCFTGQLAAQLAGKPISRAQAEALARDHGLVVAKSVTKKLNILVVADPNTLSSKAKKAREYGTRIMAEAAFWSALGVQVE